MDLQKSAWQSDPRIILARKKQTNVSPFTEDVLSRHNIAGAQEINDYAAELDSRNLICTACEDML